MTCTFFDGGVMCWNPIHRLRLENGQHIFMDYNLFYGPVFYRDRRCSREIEDWWDDPLVCKAFELFLQKGEYC